jgi:hypothetical protein
MRPRNNRRDPERPPVPAHEDVIAREMARLTYEKVVKISEVQDGHTTRLSRLEGGMDELKSDVGVLKSDVGDLKRGQDEFEQRVDTRYTAV